MKIVQVDDNINKHSDQNNKIVLLYYRLYISWIVQIQTKIETPATW